jgi:polysaccharide chain length determinant protein (PEP-CTERM system associated)
MYPAVVIPSVMLGAIYLAFALPPTYRATATIMLESSSIPSDLVRTTVPSSIPDENLRNAAVGYADQQFELLRRRVLARSRLVEMVGKTDPYPELEDTAPEDKAELLLDNVYIERVDPITLEPVTVSTTFSINYDNPHPELAAAIAREVAGLFLSYNLEARVQQATETYNFLKLRAEQLRSNLGTLEAKIAAFKRQNPDALPEDQIRNQEELDRTQRDLDSMQAQLRIAQQRQSALEVQLSQTNPTLVGAVTDPRTELATLKAQLAEAERKYTPDHPVVKRLRRSIDALAVPAATSSGSGTVNADNPEYLRIAAELESSRRETNAMKAQVDRAYGDITNFRRLLAGAPTVEMEYGPLARDVAVVREQLQDTEKKMHDAELASQLETEQKGERYILIRAARVPDAPYSPNRLGLILLGVVLALALGFGLAILADVVDSTVRTADDVRDVLEQPVLGSIGLLLNSEQTRLRRRRLVIIAGAFAAASVIVAFTVVRALTQPEAEQNVTVAEAPRVEP